MAGLLSWWEPWYNGAAAVKTLSYLASLGMDAEGRLEQVIHLFGDLHIQAWIGKGKYHLLPRSQQLLLAPSVSALGVEHLPAAGR